MKTAHLWLALFLLLCSKSYGGITDTLHVSHYNITIDSVNYTSRNIWAVTEVTVHSKLNGVNSIPLSLTTLTVDSVSANGSPLVYTHTGNVIRITPPSSLNQNDSLVIRVRYRGMPWIDPSFGGFYFSGNNAYNMGVCIQTDPHNAGKAWFPCIDEFTDHATYEFHITTAAGYKAFCNGTLESSVTNPNGSMTWNWEMKQPIVTYLASVAIGQYYTIRRTYQGIPVEIAVLAGDSANTLTTFQHLDSVLMYFINSYGPYPYDKVGYAAVPFNGGAMEHATSIHIGKVYLNGTLTYEPLWVHELSHMWWGDMVTCETAEDMWLNEGWATYNENAYREFIYGKQAYMNAARTLHRSVVQFSNISDGGYYALNNIPHSITYGTTVYSKGGDVAHSLRRFMGDSAFFKACKYHLAQQAYSNTNSNGLRDNFAASSGINLTDYFNTIVYTPGFPHVSLDSFAVAPNGGNYDVTIYTRQRQKGNTQVFTLPVEFTFSDQVKDTSITFTVNAATNSFTASIPFVPKWVAVDRNERLSDAVVDYENQINGTGVYAFPETNAGINVLNAGSGTSLVRIEHNYVKPDDFKTFSPGVRLSDYHYYKADGILSSGFQASATFNYDGSLSISTGYLDHTLIKGTAREDSLLIYYRPHSGEDWQLVNGFIINYNGSHTDKRGSITVDTLKLGEYVFAVRDYTVGMNEIIAQHNGGLLIYPNPARDRFMIYDLQFMIGEKALVEVYDALGEKVYEAVPGNNKGIASPSTQAGTSLAMTVDVSGWAKGMYFVKVSDGKKILTGKVVVE